MSISYLSVCSTWSRKFKKRVGRTVHGPLWSHLGFTLVKGFNRGKKDFTIVKLFSWLNTFQMVSQQKCVTQMMSLRTGDNSYDIAWMFYFLSSYVTVCTSYIHWKLCRCLYCFYPIIFSAKCKRSMLNYFAAVIVWKAAWWDYKTIEERWNSKRTWRFLKKSGPTKIHIQTIEKMWLHGIKKHLNDLLLNLCLTQKWNTNIRCRRMIHRLKYRIYCGLASNESENCLSHCDISTVLFGTKKGKE